MTNTARSCIFFSYCNNLVEIHTVCVLPGLHASHDGIQRKQAAVPEGLRAHHQPRHRRIRAGEAEQQHPSQENQVREEAD